MRYSHNSRLFFLILSLLTFQLFSFAQGSIAKRWIAAGKYKHGNVVPEGKKSKEYEFLKNNTLNIYEGGVIIGSGTYVMATDSKSVLIKNGNQGVSIKIFKLTAAELIMIFSPVKDTVVFYPSGSAAAKNAQAKAVSYVDLQKNWLKLSTQYQMRNDLVSSFWKSVENDTDVNNDIFTRLAATRKEISESPFDIKSPSKAAFEKHTKLQEKYAKDIADFGEFLKKYPKVMESDRYKDFTSMLPQIETAIKNAQAAFTKSFSAYQGK